MPEILNLFSTPEWLEALAALVTALAGVAGAAVGCMWPIVTLGFLMLYRRELGSLIEKSKKWSLFGNEIEMRDDVRQLEDGVQRVQEEVRQIEAEGQPVVDGRPTQVAGLSPQSNTETPHTQRPSQPSDKQVDADGPSTSIPLRAQADSASTKMEEDRISRFANESPVVAIVLLSAEIEASMRRLVEQVGVPGEQSNVMSYRQLISALSENYRMPASLSPTLQRFWNIRNHVVHGHNQEQETLRDTIVLGRELLQAIEALRHSPAMTESVLLSRLERALLDELVELGDLVLQREPLIASHEGAGLHSLRPDLILSRIMGTRSALVVEVKAGQPSPDRVQGSIAQVANYLRALERSNVGVLQGLALWVVPTRTMADAFMPTHVAFHGATSLPKTANPSVPIAVEVVSREDLYANARAVAKRVLAHLPLLAVGANSEDPIS